MKEISVHPQKSILINTNMPSIRNFFFVVGFLLCGIFLSAQSPLPELRQPLTDVTGTLSSQEAELINQQLLNINKNKGAQLAVVIINTTESETIEAYSLRLAEKWKLGRKGIDDGVLLLIAKDDRSLHIEVGYGLEGVLNDAICKRIIDEIITPEFKNNNFYQGIQAGVNQITKIIDGETLPEPKPSMEEPQSIIVFLLIAIFAMIKFLRNIFGRLIAALIVGVGVGSIIWFWIAVMLPAVIFGVIAFALALSDMSSRGFPGRFGGMGGSGNSGGFRGGGGRFGGGGASGRW